MTNHRHRATLPIVAILVAATALRGWRLDALSVWFDEAWSAFAAAQPTPWAAAAADPTNPPLYYVLLHLVVRGAGDDAVVLRWVSVLVGAVGLALAYQLGRQAFGARAGCWAALVCGLSPLLWWASREARMYSLLAAAATLTGIGWLRLLERPARGAWLALVTGELALLWSHNSGPVFVLALNAATGLVWLVRRTVAPPGWRRWLAAQALVVAAWAPWQLPATLRLGPANSAVGNGPVLAPSLLVHLWEALWSGSWAIVGHEPALLGLGLLLAAATVVVVPWRQAAARRLVGLWLLTVGGMVAALVVLGNELHGRYLVLAAPFVLVPIGAGLARPRWRWLRWLALAALAAAAMGVAWLTLTRAGYGNDDARAMVKHYAETLAAGDTVLAWSYADRYDLRYYWDRREVAAQLQVLPEGIELADVLPRLPRAGRVALNVWYAQRADDRGMLGCLLEHGSRAAPERHDVPGMTSYSFAAPDRRPELRQLDVSLPVGVITAAGTIPPFAADRALCLPVVLRLAGTTPDSLQVALIVRDADGRELAHSDSVFADATQRTSRQLGVGARLTAFPLVRLPHDVPAGPYEVVARVYDAGHMSGYESGAGADIRLGWWRPAARTVAILAGGAALMSQVPAGGRTLPPDSCLVTARTAMSTLPLFPLHTVLFPGMPLALHVFEERYKEMMDLCLSEQRPFGVVLIREGDEVGPAAEPHDVGCSASVLDVERLTDGRLNLVALGVERFRIARLRQDRAYLRGEVELWPLPMGDAALALAQAEALRPRLEDYLGLLGEAAGQDFDLDQLPDDPARLAHSAAYLLQAPPAQKQRLLTSDSIADQLQRLNALYRAELPLLRAMLASAGPRKFGGFSLS